MLGMSTFAEFGSASFELMASEVSLLPDSLEFGKSCRDGAAIGWFKVWNSRVEVALPSVVMSQWIRRVEMALSSSVGLYRHEAPDMCPPLRRGMDMGVITVGGATGLFWSPSPARLASKDSLQPSSTRSGHSLAPQVKVS